MTLLHTRSRAEHVAHLLDGPPEAGSAAALAGRLRSVGADLGPLTAPGPEFRARLRTRLVAVATVQAATAATHAAAGPAPSPSRPLVAAVAWSQSRRGQRGIGLAAGAMASVVAVAGVAIAGSRSLPGDPFYGLKRGGEAWELTSTSGDVARGTKELEFAAERLREVRELTLGRDAAYGGSVTHPEAADAVGASVSNRIRSTLADMDRETAAGGALLTNAYRTAHRSAPLQILHRFAGRQSSALQALLPALPAGARARAELSLALVSGVGMQASQLLAIGQCTTQCAPSQASPALSTGSSAAPGSPPARQPTSVAPCGCPSGPTQPAASTSAAPTTRNATVRPSTTPSPAPAPSPTPAGARPTTSPTPAPLPVPTTSPAVPVTVPALPVPLPTPTTPAVPAPVVTLPVAVLSP